MSLFWIGCSCARLRFFFRTSQALCLYAWCLLVRIVFLLEKVVCVFGAARVSLLTYGAWTVPQYAVREAVAKEELENEKQRAYKIS